MSAYTGIAGLSASMVARNSRHVRELQRIGPQPWVYIGDYPGDTFTRPESPTWQNSLTSVAGRRVRFRWGFDGQPDWDGMFDLTAGYVSGDVGFNIIENSDEFEGEGLEAFIPLELAVGVWSAAVFVLEADTGDARVFFPIVADPIP